jgi:DNA polymerase
LDARQIAILAEMGVRVWQPQAPLGRAGSGAKFLNLAPQNTEAPNPKVLNPDAPIPLVVRREPPLRLPVVDAPPRTADFGVTHYVIGNLPTEAADYDLVVLGEPCEGPAAQLLANVLKSFASSAPRVFVAHMVASHNDAVNLHEQLATIPNQLILALGPHAAKALLDKTSEGVPFSKLRGAVHPPRVVVTYHPQKLLSQQQAKASCWQDIGLALRTLRKS